MLKWQQHSAVRAALVALLSIGVFCSAPSSALAQDQERPSLLGSLVKEVALDPTTYAPAVIAYDATVRDWSSSQPFFRNGFMERNSRFTISGLPNAQPVSYAEGNRRILSDAAGNLSISLVNNLTDRVFERALLERYPEHRKIIRTMGWIERVSFGAYMSYLLSVDHYRQAQANALRAQQLGYR
jgi:hypothetical protein